MTRQERILGWLVCAIALGACSSARTPIAVPGADGATIPRAALTALRSAWPGAELLGSPPAASCTGGSAPAALLRGDFNGDGLDDAVLWITSPDGPRLVAAFARIDADYTTGDLGVLPTDTIATIEVFRRGATYQLATLTVDFYFGLDTVVVRQCDGTRTAYFWSGDSFRPAVLAN